MEDQKIVELYWQRSESAIEETQKKYGKYCHVIAYNILYSNEDAEECVNDTYLNAWNTIPPKSPERLQYFLGKITRNIALNRYDYNTAQKRSDGVAEISDEFFECLPSPDSPIEDDYVIKEAINSFLASLPKQTRIIFMQRYWYLCPILEISQKNRLSESNVKIILHRTRTKLKAHLEKKGVSL